MGDDGVVMWCSSGFSVRCWGSLSSSSSWGGESGRDSRRCEIRVVKPAKSEILEIQRKYISYGAIGVGEENNRNVFLDFNILF